MKRVFSLLICSLLICSQTASIFASEETTTVRTFANIESEGMQIDITVPTKLPVVRYSNGMTRVATNYEIINDSGAPVSIYEINLDSNGSWALVNSEEELTEEYLYTLSLNDVNIYPWIYEDSTEYEDYYFPVGNIPQGETLPLTYDFNFSEGTYSDTEFANIEFIFSWDFGEKYLDMSRYSYVKSLVGGNNIKKGDNIAAKFISSYIEYVTIDGVSQKVPISYTLSDTSGKIWLDGAYVCMDRDISPTIVTITGSYTYGDKTYTTSETVNTQSVIDSINW